MRMIRAVELKYDDGNSVYISGEEIARMLQAAEAIDMIRKAKEVAKRLIE